MQYYIYDASADQEQMIVEAMEWVYDKLQLRDDICIDIEMVSTAGGGCIQGEYEDDVEMYTVEINKRLGKKNMLATLFHEMVHVSQYATGRLGQDHWNGQAKPDLPYMELPWEIEAYAKEKELMCRYYQ